MKAYRLIAVIATGLVASVTLADFPQWRGPSGNGVVDEAFSRWDKDKGPEKLWTSPEIPGDGDGGFASPVCVDGKVFLFVNDKYKIPFEHRKLDGRGFDKLGGQILDLSDQAIRQIEAIRTSEQLDQLDRKQRDEYIEKKLAAIFPKPDEQKKQIKVAQRRIQAGSKAIELAELKALKEIVGRKFDSQAALEEWLKTARISQETQRAAFKQIPTASDAAKDRILCLDGRTGKTLWEKQYEGRHRGWATSSTPAVADGKLYVGGSGGKLYCLQASDGKELWVTDAGGAEINSSPVLLGGRVFIQAGRLMAFDVGDGRKLYQIDEAKNRNTSPVVWKTDEADYILTNAGGKLFCIKPENGAVLWTAPGGGTSSPAVSGDHCAIVTNNKAEGLIAYKLSPDRAEVLWKSDATQDRGASAVIHDGFVYAVTKSDAVCVHLASGQVAWKVRARGDGFSSPLIADGKIVAITGRNVTIFDGSPKQGGKQLAGARLLPLRCTSPAMADGKLLLRTKTNLVCYKLPE
ncbi:MAG: PQQ-binding-like beta-propeller repeat protein [Phycisphaerae bacterium]